METKKRIDMIYKVGDNIISSLGFTTEENFTTVKQGMSGIKHYEAGVFDLPEAFMASLIDKERLNAEFVKISPKNDYTDLEKAAILSVSTANAEAQIDLSSEKTIFILSTTKGNVLEKYLWHTAEVIAGFFGNSNTPIVVSNACISGAAAQIVAIRELEMENYAHAVVVGVDFLSKFIISGFQSFKALSPELCRPFDKDRCGLNLGEAAATIIFSKDARRIDVRRETLGRETVFSLVAGAVRNDATHISAPSRTGEGSYRALKSILQNVSNLTSQNLTSQSLTSQSLTSQISFINAHGTSTPYNDAAEMNAIVRAGLENVPVNSLKAFFGHTLGAAGVLETIISMRALSEGIVLKSLGFEQNEQLIIDNEQFTLNVCKENITTDKKYFIKMLSGFGGCNAALLFKKST
jgi:3-oxoacyl-[acyl-carrier-protein] synthase-1